MSASAVRVPELALLACSQGFSKRAIYTQVTQVTKTYLCLMYNVL